MISLIILGGVINVIVARNRDRFGKLYQEESSTQEGLVPINMLEVQVLSDTSEAL